MCECVIEHSALAEGALLVVEIVNVIVLSALHNCKILEAGDETSTLFRILVQTKKSSTKVYFG